MQAITKHPHVARHIDELSNEVWNRVFVLLDSELHLTGDEAGAIAQAASDAVKRSLHAVWECEAP